MDTTMDEDLIVLGAPAETQAAGGETSEHADSQIIEGQLAGGEGGSATPGMEPAEPGTPQPEPPKGDVEGGEERPKKRSGIQRMQDRISRLEAENASLRSAPQGASEDRKAAVEKEIGAAPKESEFTDYADFEDAKADYRIRKALAEQRHAEREAQASTRRDAERGAAVEAFQDRMDEAREKIPDFDKVVEAARGRPVAAHVGELVVESDKSALLTYYLASKPEELERLNRLGPIQAAKAIGALEQKLTLAKPKTATTAPAPAKPVTGAAAPASPDAEIDAWLAKTYGRRG